MSAEVSVPGLPQTFDGLKVALVTDLHLGPLNSEDFVSGVVNQTNALNADLIALGGDFVEGGTGHFQPCFRQLSRLQAPLGVYGVPGNHDMACGGRPCRAAMRAAGITDLTNAGVWVERGGHRFLFAGVDDLWHGRPDLNAALSSAGPQDPVVVLSHNPDLAEEVEDPRVGLILSGHTHGGQIYLPGYGAPIVPSRYGEKYLYGLARGPVVDVFTSPGVGVVALPFRFCAPPEINLLTLRSAPSRVSFRGAAT